MLAAAGPWGRVWLGAVTRALERTRGPSAGQERPGGSPDALAIQEEGAARRPHGWKGAEA